MPTDNVVQESQTYTDAVANEPNGRLFRNWTSMDRQYEPWLALYKDIALYIAPGRGRFLDQEAEQNQRTKAAEKIINPTAPDALHMLGAGLHGGLSSPARPWFQLNFEDPGLNKFSTARQWLDDCEKIIYGVLKRSNFYNVIHNVYEEVGAFSTGALFVDQHPEHIINVSYLTAGDYRIAINSLCRCHCMYRKLRFQVHQLAEMFGVENMSDTAQRLLKTNPYQWREVLHVIEPNSDYDPDALSNTSFKFRSIYVESRENTKRLSDSGYHEMPIVTPRWSSKGYEAYGWGPGPEALGLAKAIQRMEVKAMLAEEKMIDPPLGVLAGYHDRMTSLSPGAKIPFRDTDDARKAFTKLVEIDPQSISIFEAKIDKAERRLQRIFFYELFLMIAQDDKRMTATEVAARQEEKMIMLGPTVESLIYELLDPTIDRVFNLCARAGALPPPPPDVQNAQYKVEYISILAQAQKLIQAQGMNVYRQAVGEVAAINPESVDKTDWDVYIEEFGDLLNIPTKVVREQDKVDEIRAQRAEATSKQQQIIEDQANADTMQKLGSATTTTDTALGKLSEQMAGA